MPYYDGVLKKPFAFEHWHKGFVAAAAIWLPTFSVAIAFNASMSFAVGVAFAASALLAVAVFTHHTRFSLDADSQRYRSVLWVAGLRFGTWEKLPTIACIKLRPYQQKHRFSLADTASSTQTGFSVIEHHWQVLLLPANASVGIVAAYCSHARAVRIAAALSEALEKPVVTTA